MVCATISGDNVPDGYGHVGYVRDIALQHYILDPFRRRLQALCDCVKITYKHSSFK